MAPSRAILVGLGLLGMYARADALSQQYCSSENTGEDYNAVYNIYQSNGACYDQCQDNYAFAIVQYQNCWCSNYIPAEQQSTSSCNQNCPGYPDDKCGNSTQGLYGYIALNKQPSGTAGAASSTQASSTPASSWTSEPSSTQPPTTESTSTSQPQTSTVQSTTSVQPTTDYTPSPSSSYDPPTTSSYLSPSSTSTSASSSDPSTAVVPLPGTTETSSSSARPSATPSPVTSVQVVTISGAIVTQTVTSTPSVAPNADPDTALLQRKGLSGGAIAGAVIGSLLGVAALLFGAFLLWRRKSQNGDAEGSFHGPHSPRRNVSVLSKTGLLSRGRPASITEKDYDDSYAHNLTGNNSVRHSMLFGAGGAGEGISPVSPLGSAHDGSDGRRHSRPMIYDQRLNPSALFANAEANGSRVSMQDQQDYSRSLGIVNPDVRPSFESRNS